MLLVCTMIVRLSSHVWPRKLISICKVNFKFWIRWVLHGQTIEQSLYKLTLWNNSWIFILKKHGKNTNFWLKTDALFRICVELVCTWGHINRVYDLSDISNKENKYRVFIGWVYRVHTIDICLYPTLEQKFRKKWGRSKKKFAVICDKMWN